MSELYTVKEGDTIYGICAAKLGDGNRWPEVFRLNRRTIERVQEVRCTRAYAANIGIRPFQPEDWIFPGTQLQLPTS